MNDKMAKAVHLSAHVSTKVASEIGRRITGKTPKDAIKMLQDVLDMRAPMPYSRFNWNVAHRVGHVGPGRYPQIVSQTIIDLINAVVANAVHQSLDENKLVIASFVPQKGAKTYKYSRMRGLKTKNTHLEIVVEEQEPKAKRTTPRTFNTSKDSSKTSSKNNSSK